jgi:hypothetical protein
VLLNLAPLVVRADELSRLFRPTESTAPSDIVDFAHTASFRLGSVFVITHRWPPGMPPFVSEEIHGPIPKGKAFDEEAGG